MVEVIDVRQKTVGGTGRAVIIVGLEISAVVVGGQLCFQPKCGGILIPK